jgi:hypothetical protein
MKITTLFPLTNNDNSPFPEEQIENLLKNLALQFNGCSTDGKVKGRSVDYGVEHKDESLRVTIVCTK